MVEMEYLGYLSRVHLVFCLCFVCVPKSVYTKRRRIRYQGVFERGSEWALRETCVGSCTRACSKIQPLFQKCHIINFNRKRFQKTTWYTYGYPPFSFFTWQQQLSAVDKAMELDTEGEEIKLFVSFRFVSCPSDETRIWINHKEYDMSILTKKRILFFWFDPQAQLKFDEFKGGGGRSLSKNQISKATNLKIWTHCLLFNRSLDQSLNFG